jgi:hypothetical protein
MSAGSAAEAESSMAIKTEAVMTIHRYLAMAAVNGCIEVMKPPGSLPLRRREYKTMHLLAGVFL